MEPIANRRLAIVTAARDRRDLLQRLLSTLECQSDQDFVWIVINDASTDSTASWLDQVAATSPVTLCAITHQKQRGKCASLNHAFEEVDAEFYLVVDSDDQLHPNAVSLVNNQVDRWTRETRVGAIFFSYVDVGGKLLGGPTSPTSVVATRAVFDARWGKYDGCVGYFRRVVERYRYPEFEGELYCGPTVLQLMMAPAFSICFTPVVLGTAEYQPDGLSAGGRALRVKSPRGMMEYTRLQYEQSPSWHFRLRHMVMHFAYSHLAASKGSVKPSPINVPAALAGRALATVWCHRYAVPEVRRAI